MGGCQDPDASARTSRKKSPDSVQYTILTAGVQGVLRLPSSRVPFLLIIKASLLLRLASCRCRVVLGMPYEEVHARVC